MTISRIESADDERLDVYARMTGRQLRNLLDPTDATVVCESLFVIRTAVECGLDVRSVMVDERHLDHLLDQIPALRDSDIPIFIAAQSVLSQIAGFKVTRGYFADVRRPAEKRVCDVLAGASRIAVLEGLVDVSNVGAVFRSAAALGVDGILLAPSCADPLNRRAVRTSMGTVFQIPWARVGAWDPKAVAQEHDAVTWPENALVALRDEGFTTLALALDERAVSLADPSLRDHDRLALFFGTEGTGLSDRVLAGVDQTVIIPMRAGVDSLNVAASSAVAFWELCSKR